MNRRSKIIGEIRELEEHGEMAALEDIEEVEDMGEIEHMGEIEEP